jgi:hypothetical protein
MTDDRERLPKQGTFINLGTQVTNAAIMSSICDKDREGNDVIYSVIVGRPGKLVVIDLKTSSVKKIFDLPGADGSWDMVRAKDGNVYIGSYPNGRVYQFNPESDTVTDLGQAFEGQSFVWCLAAGKGKEVYGGTFNGGNVFKYGPDEKFADVLGQVVPGEIYVRGIAYDENKEVIYAGIGSHAHLIRYHCKTGTRKDILPEEYRNEEFAYHIRLRHGKIFVLVTPKAEVLVMDQETEKLEYVIPCMNSRTLSEISPYDYKIYYTCGEELYYYDIEAREHGLVGIKVQGNAVAYEFIELNEEGYPGYSLVIFLSGGKILKYNLQNKNYYCSAVELPEQPSQIQSIKKGPDSKVYTNAYLVGGNASYDPDTEEIVQFKVIGQAEGITYVGNKMYFGVYPAARIYEYDVTRSVELEGKNLNPKELFSLRAHEQDRPFGMLGVEEENKLFIGTVSDYGRLGGVFAIYDLSNRELKVSRNIIKNQSIISLAYNDGLVYGGTSIWGGLGAIPSEKEAKLFIWDVKSGEKIFECIPIESKKAITALMKGPDGNIWGFAEGTLFIFDVRSKTVYYREDKFPIDYTGFGHLWRDIFIQLAPDGNIYGTTGGQLFKMDPISKGIKILRDKGAFLLTIDNQGHIYFTNGSDLWKYIP